MRTFALALCAGWLVHGALTLAPPTPPTSPIDRTARTLTGDSFALTTGCTALAGVIVNR